MVEDKLTHAERIRLEAFAQAGMRHQMKPILLSQQFYEAEQIEQWLHAANLYQFKGQK